MAEQRELLRALLRAKLDLLMAELDNVTPGGDRPLLSLTRANAGWRATVLLTPVDVPRANLANLEAARAYPGDAFLLDLLNRPWDRPETRLTAAQQLDQAK